MTDYSLYIILIHIKVPDISILFCVDLHRIQKKIYFLTPPGLFYACLENFFIHSNILTSRMNL